MFLSELIKESGQFSEPISDIPNVEITGISYDSRKVEPGDLFFALEGETHDGHDYIDQAIRNGAYAVVGRKDFKNLDTHYFTVENPRKSLAYVSATFYGNPAHELTMIGVTGTDGKTTTVNLIYQILLACGIKAGMISTVNAVIGNEIIDTGFHVTTPESPIIHRLLRKMVNAGISHVVLETTSHGLDQYRVNACEFDIGVVTNITHEHLDYHGSYDQYLNAKFRLVEELLVTGIKGKGNYRCAVLNHDDISYAKIEKKLSQKRVSEIRKITYGMTLDADISSGPCEMNSEGLRFSIFNEGKKADVFSPLIGEYNVYNILAAIAASAVGLRLDLKLVARGVGALISVPGRMERIDLGQGFLAIVDFAHTPNALKMVLQTARKLAGERVIAVFGSAGLRDREKRRLMTAVSMRLADITILTAEDPRTEKLEDILEKMADEAKKLGGIPGKEFLVIPDRGEAITEAVKLANKTDLVIVCGKGHEQSMCFGETEYPWDDRIALRAALANYLKIPGPEMPILPTSHK